LKRPVLKLEVLAQGRVADRPEGAYQAAPMAAWLEGRGLLVAYRQAWIDETWLSERSDHGQDADIWLVRSLDCGLTFEPPRLIIDHRLDETNEFDALITALGEDRVALISRAHRIDFVGSFGALSQDGGQTFSPRQPLDLDQWPIVFFGHLLPDGEEGGWLGSFYTYPWPYPGPGLDQPGLARLGLDGSPPELVGWIWEGRFEDSCLNETSMLRLADGRLLAVIRQEPCLEGLFAASSQDNGRTWSKPEPIGLFGEAPGLLLLPDGRLMVIFRGLGHGEENYIGLALSEDGGRSWSWPYVLETYTGGRFHGGYGDLVLTPSGEIVAVYYLAQRGETPVIGCSVLGLKS